MNADIAQCTTEVANCNKNIGTIKNICTENNLTNAHLLKRIRFDVKPNVCCKLLLK